jgi:GNAT superfamily N-acetyltransferase
MIVRKMQPSEIDVTVNLFGYYRDEATLTMPEIDEEYDENSVIETIRLYSSHYEYCWFNAYEGQRPVGLVAGCVTQTPWNHKLLVGHIDMIYLLESHRNMANVQMLYDEFVAWAKLSGCTKITAGDIGINPDRTRKVYTHLGFKEAVMMTKELAE